MKKLLTEFLTTAIVVAATVGGTYYFNTELVRADNETKTMQDKIDELKKEQAKKKAEEEKKENIRQLDVLKDGDEIDDLASMKEQDIDDFKQQKQEELASMRGEKDDDGQKAAKQKRKVDKYILAGDSRFVGMSMAKDTDEDYYIAKGSTGLSYFKSIASEIKKKDDGNSAIVIGFGVNDLRNADDYVSFVNNAGFRSNVYFLTVNPVDEDNEARNGYSVKNSDIEKFNKTLVSGAQGYAVIDTYSYLKGKGFDTIDGVHYTTDTYKDIYSYIKSYVNVYNT